MNRHWKLVTGLAILTTAMILIACGDEEKPVMAILIYGESYGVTSSNVSTSSTGDTKVDWLLGHEGSWGQPSLGLSQTAAQGRGQLR